MFTILFTHHCITNYPKSSVQFSCSVMSDSLQLHELQHARPPCPSPTLGAHHQPSHSLSSPSPPALNLSQHQGLVKWVSSSHQVAKVLEFQLQHHTFQRNPRTSLFHERVPLIGVQKLWLLWSSSSHKTRLYNPVANCNSLSKTAICG